MLGLLGCSAVKKVDVASLKSPLPLKEDLNEQLTVGAARFWRLLKDNDADQLCWLNKESWLERPSFFVLARTGDVLVVSSGIYDYERGEQRADRRFFLHTKESAATSHRFFFRRVESALSSPESPPEEVYRDIFPLLALSTLLTIEIEIVVGLAEVIPCPNQT